MTHQEKNKNQPHTQSLSLVEAVETLTEIKELSVGSQGIEQSQDHPLEKNRKRGRSEVLRLNHKNIDLSTVKQIFQTILNHLKELYSNSSSYVVDEKRNERVKTIMILVGDAALKLDRLSNLFSSNPVKSIHDLKEYKLLQEFYIHKIARKIDEKTLGRWILGLSAKILEQDEKKSEKETQAAYRDLHTNHVFIDLEGVKKDSEYELFFIRKEDGTRFFNPKLIRSIKLVCDFGSYFKGQPLVDPFADISFVIDKSLNSYAKGMVDNLKNTMDKFYHESKKENQNELVMLLHKAFLALLLASNTKNLLKKEPVKSCSEYFVDFQTFLRSALKGRDYQKMIAYKDEMKNPFKKMIETTLESILRELYLGKPAIQEIISFVENLIHESLQEHSKEHEEAVSDSRQLWSQLASQYNAMSKLMKQHPAGHLQKVLNVIEEGSYNSFDPLLQGNYPMELSHLFSDELKMVNIKMAAPVTQENIEKVMITEEFKTFLRGLQAQDPSSKYLIFNYQDRTSWREHARAKSLEDLQKNPEFKDHLVVVTLPKETEFYNQESPYDRDNKAQDFIHHLKEHLKDDNGGFYFGEAINRSDLDQFIEKAIKIVHQLFFHSKNVLSVDQRADFIEIFYFFLEMKIIDLVKPNKFSLVCKDAIDISNLANLKLFAFLNILNQEGFSESDLEYINVLAFGIPLLSRERLVLKEKFTRIIGAIKSFESIKTELGAQNFGKIIKEAFALMYDATLLDAKIVPLR